MGISGSFLVTSDMRLAVEGIGGKSMTAAEQLDTTAVSI
jgi:hypothetical protein